jgi:hypothetical protein
MAIRVGREVRRSERAAARLDGDLVEPVLRAGQQSHDRMAGLVKRDEPALLIRHDDARAHAAEQNLVARLIEMVARDDDALRVHGENRRLVQQIRELGAGIADSERRELLQIDVRIERSLGRVHREDLESIRRRGHADFDDAVETAGATNGGVEHVFAVRGRHPHDPFAARHPVHLDEQLVQREVFLARAVRRPRLPPMESNSSMKMMQRPWARAFDARSRTRPRANADVHLTEFGAGCD